MSSEINTIDPVNWVENYADHLYSYAFYRVYDKELAEDLVQDTFLSGIAAKATFRGQASEKTWLTGILKNKIIDHFRKASTRKETILKVRNKDEDDYEYFFNEAKMGHWQESAAPIEWRTAGELTEKKEFYRVLEACLGKLPMKWKGVFTMSLLQDENATKVCKEFEITSSNFWVIMHRAKLQIRECLEKNWMGK